jgi:hypothetical protein
VEIASDPRCLKPVFGFAENLCRLALSVSRPVPDSITLLNAFFAVVTVGDTALGLEAVWQRLNSKEAHYVHDDG